MSDTIFESLESDLFACPFAGVPSCDYDDDDYDDEDDDWYDDEDDWYDDEDDYEEDENY